MQECDALNRYVAHLEASDGAEEPEEDLLAHLEHCEHCRAELGRVRRAAASVLSYHFDDHADAPHLSDLDLAIFVAHGLDAPNADDAVTHLASCRECRRQFRQVRRLLEQHEDLIYGDAPRSTMPDRSFADQVRLVFSDPARVARVVSGFLAWILEWAMLVVVVFQVGVGHLVNPNAIGISPATEFLGIMPRAPLRFWLITGTCIVLALFFRWLGIQLYHSAVEQERR